MAEPTANGDSQEVLKTTFCTSSTESVPAEDGGSGEVTAATPSEAPIEASEEKSEVNGAAIFKVVTEQQSQIEALRARIYDKPALPLSEIEVPVVGIHADTSLESEEVVALATKGATKIQKDVQQGTKLPGQQELNSLSTVLSSSDLDKRAWPEETVTYPAAAPSSQYVAENLHSRTVPRETPQNKLPTTSNAFSSVNKEEHDPQPTANSSPTSLTKDEPAIPQERQANRQELDSLSTGFSSFDLDKRAWPEDTVADSAAALDSQSLAENLPSHTCPGEARLNVTSTTTVPLPNVSEKDHAQKPSAKVFLTSVTTFNSVTPQKRKAAHDYGAGIVKGYIDVIDLTSDDVSPTPPTAKKQRQNKEQGNTQNSQRGIATKQAVSGGNVAQPARTREDPSTPAAPSPKPPPSVSQMPTAAVSAARPASTPRKPLGLWDVPEIPPSSSTKQLPSTPSKSPGTAQIHKHITAQTSRNTSATNLSPTKTPSRTPAAINPATPAYKKSVATARSATPSPVINRNKTISRVGVQYTDLAKFSIKPPYWLSWAAKEYADFAEALTASFDPIPFATANGKTIEEVRSVFTSLVRNPLWDASEASRRGKTGMQQLFESHNKFGTPIRKWGKDTGKIAMGELLGLKDERVVLMTKSGEEATCSIHDLSADDMKYLDGVLNQQDKEYLRSIQLEKNSQAADGSPSKRKFDAVDNADSAAPAKDGIAVSKISELGRVQTGAFSKGKRISGGITKSLTACKAIQEDRPKCAPKS
ncbi:hypothetical protein B0A49_01004 [Cryomyces minteri]|uniref:Uncharacterized protein n=1 Tax=Cryomyces minteri TaxID=331657 RepID=A0A4U0XS02_9PEZI|nr:hypothetical protein B0A49_01004 [Cryomyces minteri]